MAPAHFKSSKPKFQPRAGTKVLAGRIEKKASKQSNLTVHTFATVLTIRTRNDATNDAPTDHAMQDTVDTALTGQVNEESLVTNPPSATEAPVLATKEMNKPFKLDEAIPKAGLRFLGEWDGRKRSIMGRWTSENEVAKALHADMAIIHKRHAQGVISPIFHQAAKMLEDGYMWGLARHEDITEEEARDNWKRFLGRLWADSVRKWPGRLSQKRFAHFFSALAEARWAGIHQPKIDAREPGLLVQHISLFLDAADRAVSPGPLEAMSSTMMTMSENVTWLGLPYLLYLGSL
ncbi:hypothetical protein F5883DRAFT_551872 [Diaporthe sp. PMI_573]|nr:hypothetical protein F5883DRAFT_551872 [Diaporthaceae sp. PMI_573]